VGLPRHFHRNHDEYGWEPPEPENTDRWYRDGLTKADLPQGWTNNWSEWDLWGEWQGLPGDEAWMLEHRDRFYGRPTPLAHNDKDILCVRAGGLHFLTFSSGGLRIFLPTSPLLNNFPDVQHSATQPQEDSRYTAGLETRRFQLLWKIENGEMGRNRWVEQKQRGGFPTSVLLKMLHFRPSLTPTHFLDAMLNI
jgi:hypothetical protein